MLVQRLLELGFAGILEHQQLGIAVSGQLEREAMMQLIRASQIDLVIPTNQ